MQTFFKTLSCFSILSNVTAFSRTSGKTGHGSTTPTSLGEAPWSLQRGSPTESTALLKKRPNGPKLLLLRPK
jgi:hypothetical protein